MRNKEWAIGAALSWISGVVVLVASSIECAVRWQDFTQSLRTCAATETRTAPLEIERYTLFHLVGDMVGVLDSLGEKQAVIVGHDWGAPVACMRRSLRPDRFRAVVGLSVPYRPRGSIAPTSVMPQNADASFYQLYFQDFRRG